MLQPDKILYEAEVTATGGRDGISSTTWLTWRYEAKVASAPSCSTTWTFVAWWRRG